MRRSLITAFAALSFAATAVPTWACGFEDPNSVPLQRVMLNLVYPNALHVLGAADTALRDGLLRSDHFTRPGDPFAFHRTGGALRRFAGNLADGAPSDLPGFSLVLLGPVLWTRFHPDPDGIVAEIHAAGPLADRVVMVTDVPVMAALVSGDVSGAGAEASGLVRLYGDPAEIVGLRKALALAFPAGLAQSTRVETRAAIPTAR